MSGNYSIDQALYSSSYAKKCYINYYYQNNTMGISSGDMGKIVNQWGDEKVESWKRYAETDENKYEITNDEYSDFVEDGKAQGQEATGYNGNQGWQYTRTCLDGVSAGVSGVHAAGSTTSGAGKLLGSNGGKAATTATKECLDRFLLISCALDLANGLIGYIAPANKEQKEACDTLNEQMSELQSDSAGAANDIVTMDEELQEHTDYVNETAEAANESMAEGKATYDYHRQTIDNYEHLKTQGYEFSEDEIEAYQASMQYMQEINAEIEGTYADNSDEITGTYETMGEYQDGFDEAAETIGNVEGVTEYAEGFDEETQTLCKTEQVIQYVQAAAAGVDTFEAIAKAASTAIGGGMIIYGAAAAAAAAGGIFSLKNASTQGEYATAVGEEIDARKETQELNAQSKDIYDENIDYYEGYMQDVEDVELVKPDDIDVPEGEVPTLGGNQGPAPEEDDPAKKPKEDK